MAPTSDPRSDVQAIRARIGRLRRRIDQRIHGVERRVWRATSWRALLRRYPQGAVGAVLGLGLTISAALGKGRWPEQFRLPRLRRAAKRFLTIAARELGASTTPPDKQPDHATDDG